MEEKYVDVKGTRTRYLEGGTGEPLLLVHGGHYGTNCSANDWDPVLNDFAKSYHVFAPDKIGCGYTDNPGTDEDYIMRTMVQHIHDFLGILAIDRAHIIGHSRGGYAVCRLALEHPEVVKTLVIVDCGTLMLAFSPLHSQWEKEVALIEDERERIRYPIVANSFGGEHITDDFLDTLVEIERLPKSKKAVANMKAGLMSQFTADLKIERNATHEWIRAGGIKAPTLIVWGYNDPTAKLDPMGIAAMHLIFPTTPNAQINILNQAGHWSFREQPEAFVSAVASFITPR